MLSFVKFCNEKWIWQKSCLIINSELCLLELLIKDIEICKLWPFQTLAKMFATL